MARRAEPHCPACGRLRGRKIVSPSFIGSGRRSRRGRLSKEDPFHENHPVRRGVDPRQRRSGAIRQHGRRRLAGQRPARSHPAGHGSRRQACTPAGYNANTTGYPTCEAGAGSPASGATPPRCSKTVKDHCVQAYERGRPPLGRWGTRFAGAPLPSADRPRRKTGSASFRNGAPLRTRPAHPKRRLEMKLVMMAAALMLGSAAVAQTTTEEEPDTTTETTTDTTTETTPPPDATTSIPPPATTPIPRRRYDPDDRHDADDRRARARQHVDDEDRGRADGRAGQCFARDRRPRHQGHLGRRHRSRRLQPGRAHGAGRQPDADRGAADSDRLGAAAALHPHRHRPLHPDLRARPRQARRRRGAVRGAPLSSPAPICHEPPASGQREDRRPMTISFEGRVAIVTGAGGGLGRAYALELARRGARVVVNDLGGARDGSGSSDAAAQGGRGDRGGRRRGDGQRRQRHRCRSRSRRWSPRRRRAGAAVHILINNAGILRDKSFAKMSVEDFRAVVDVHLIGSANLHQGGVGDDARAGLWPDPDDRRARPASTAISARPITAPPSSASPASPRRSTSKARNTTSGSTRSRRPRRPG